jgi:hypothetical protein
MFLKAQSYGTRRSPIRNKPQPIILSWWKKLAAFFAVVFFMVAFRWGIEYLFHWQHPSAIGALIIPVAVALPLSFGRPRFRQLLLKSGSLTMGNDFIEGHTQMSWFTVKKRLYRDEIKCISENRRGLRVMNRGKFGTFMTGFVFVPAALAEYQEIKAVLEQWMPIQARG